MSAGEKRITLAEGHRIMGALIPLLGAGALRVAGVGSYIRRRPMLADLEILAIPRTVEADVEVLDGKIEVHADGQAALFRGAVNGVWLELQRLISQDRAVPVRPAIAVRPETGDIPQDEAWYARRLPGTVRKLRVWLPRANALVEVYLCPAEEWGVQETFRVGPADFSKAIAARAKRIKRPIRGGRVWYDGEPLPTPEPEDVFRALGLRWVPRPLRRDGRDLREL